MAWFSGKVSLGSFPDLAGAVNKISEGVKNLEKNLDGAFGLEEKSESDSSTATVTATEGSGLWPLMTSTGQKSKDHNVESSWKSGSPQKLEEVEEKEQENSAAERSLFEDKMIDEGKGEDVKEDRDDEHPVVTEKKEAKIPEVESKPALVEPPESVVHIVQTVDLVDNVQEKEISEVGPTDSIEPEEPKSVANEMHEFEDGTLVHNESQVEDGAIVHDESPGEIDGHDSKEEHRTQPEKALEESSPVHAEVSNNDQVETSSNYAHTEASSDIQAEAVMDPSGSQPGSAKEHKMGQDFSFSVAAPSDEILEMVSSLVSHENDANTKTVEQGEQILDLETDTKEQYLNSGSSASDAIESVLELNKLKLEMKMMETALQGAARQAQAKADEIAKMMNENEHLKAVIEDLKRKSLDAEESLREEYHQRVATLERKVYALTRERDTLRREQSKKSDAAALLKEKDEIINQVMAEGEELSKKQAAQEATIRKLRAQIRELEEEKKGLTTKLQVEENKVESIRKDKMATEKLLQETIERHQADLVAQKEYYTNALTAAKEAEALAEARANNEARTELESFLREAEERETMLVQTLDELRQTLSRKEQQAVFQEDMLRRDIEDLQKQYQASERRCEELVTQVPESTRPLMRQINALQETMARRTEAWNAVERTLNSQLQEAEARAASAEERERSVNRRLSQTLSRINVLEAQISCLRAEQSQLSRSLEKERQRAAENRQEYLAAKEEADTQEGRSNQLEEEIKKLKQKHKEELQDSLTHRELLQQEIEREKTARLGLERVVRAQSMAMSDRTSIHRSNSALENGNLPHKLSSASSLGSMEESYFLQASLDASSDSSSERRNPGEATISPYFMKNMTPSAFEFALRQKEGELTSYMSRLASMESIRDSLAEELVKMTAQCEKLQAESALLPGIQAELEALRWRHSAALELMGERDEELEELRADIVDLKEMYREQVDLLVNKIQIMSSSIGNAG